MQLHLTVLEFVILRTSVHLPRISVIHFFTSVASCESFIGGLFPQRACLLCAGPAHKCWLFDPQLSEQGVVDACHSVCILQ